jgi:hypothetical protein
VRLEGLGKLKEIRLIGTRTHDLPASSIVPQPTTLTRAPFHLQISINFVQSFGVKSKFLAAGQMFAASVVWWFLATDPEVPGSIPGATRFSEK